MDAKTAYDRYVTTHFQGGGKLEDAFFRAQERYFQKNYLPHLPADRATRVVDLGCGLGHFLTFLLHEGYTNIQGVDAAAECVAECQARGLPVTQGEISEFLENTADPMTVIVLNDVLEHQTKEQLFRILRSTYARLDADGILMAKVPNMANPLLGTDSRYLDITHEVGFNEDSLAQVLRQAGFRDVAVSALDIYVFPGLTNWAARQAARALNALFRFLFRLYGRTETTIFSKHILAIARKRPTPSPSGTAT